MTRLLDEGQRWRFDVSDCLPWLAGLPAGCADLVVCSPPYTGARLYLEAGENLGIVRDSEQWAAWMGQVVRECVRVCKGLVAVVCDDQQVDFSYGGGPFLLLADMIRAGICARRPAVYYRVGIPGSGHDAWRNDWEPVLLFTRGGRLPWSDPTACGHAPKWAPGGECSHRRGDGTRVNQWGGGTASGSQRRKGGARQKPGRPSHKATRGHTPPAIANPGNVIRCTVGGGQMGDALATENEAPYPEQLVEPFVLTFCPVGGLVLDPFSGSGTTVSVAVATGRRGLGCDLRPSQVALATRRLLEVTPPLPGMEP